jgi:hypothetical protein
MNRRYARHLTLMAVISVAAWAGFAAIFRSMWPGGTGETSSLAPFWAWLVVGGGAFVAATQLLLRVLRTPAAWRLGAAIALTAPALACDVFTIIFFDRWFPGSGVVDSRSYAALIIGGVSAILAAAVLTTPAQEASP